MKIERTMSEFAMLVPGDCFERNDSLYIKIEIDEDCGKNAVCVATGNTAYFQDYANVVTRPDAKVIL